MDDQFMGYKPNVVTIHTVRSNTYVLVSYTDDHSGVRIIWVTARKRF